MACQADSAGPAISRVHGIVYGGTIATMSNAANIWAFPSVDLRSTSAECTRPAWIGQNPKPRQRCRGGCSYWNSCVNSIGPTCRLQGRNTYEYLVEAMDAKFADDPAPSLLPSGVSAAAKVA